METEYTLQQLLEAVAKGEVKEGDTFETTSGKVIYSEKTFSWISERGFILNPLQVSFETLHLIYKKLVGVKEIETAEAMTRLNCGETVTLVIYYPDNNKVAYILDSLEALDNVAKKLGFSTVYYQGQYFIDVIYEYTDPEPAVDEVATKVKNYQKLSYADAYNINVYFNEKQKTALEIAEQYGISDRMVYYIAQGRYWADAHRQYLKDYVMSEI